MRKLKKWIVLLLEGILFRRGRTVEGQVKIFGTRRKFKELFMASQFSAVCQIISCILGVKRENLKQHLGGT
jgi:hypothetical protein